MLTSIGQPFQGPNQSSCTLNQKQTAGSPGQTNSSLLRLMHNAAPVLLHTFCVLPVHVQGTCCASNTRYGAAADLCTKLCASKEKTG